MPLWQVVLATVALCVSTIGSVASWASAAQTRDALLAQHQLEQDRRIERMENAITDLAQIKSGMDTLLGKGRQ